MVRINDLLVLGTVILASSILFKKRYSDPEVTFIEKGIINQQARAQETIQQTLGSLSQIDNIYKQKDSISFQAIQDVTTAQDKLQQIRSQLQQIRSQTLAQEKQKTDIQIDYLQTQKQKSNVIISQLKKVIDIGKGEQTYSPRVRGIIMRTKGYDPVDYGAIERGKQAQSSTQSIQSFIKNLDSRISNLKSSFQSLTSI